MKLTVVVRRSGDECLDHDFITNNQLVAFSIDCRRWFRSGKNVHLESRALKSFAKRVRTCNVVNQVAGFEFASVA